MNPIAALFLLHSISRSQQGTPPIIVLPPAGGGGGGTTVPPGGQTIPPGRDRPPRDEPPPPLPPPRDEPPPPPQIPPPEPPRQPPIIVAPPPGTPPTPPKAEPPLPPHIPPHDGGHKTIRSGSTGPDVVAWQKYLGITADGKFGPNTHAVTVAWQKANPPLVADGIVGPKSWEMSERVGPQVPGAPPVPPVTSRPPPPPPPTTIPPIPPHIPPDNGKYLTIKQGSTGANVTKWQQVIGVPADGKFGPGTHAATVAWQKVRGLVADGIVGPKTWQMAESQSTIPPIVVVRDGQPPPPWPMALPTDLPAFPGGWQPDGPTPPPPVQARAKQLLPELWAKGTGTRKVEKTDARWITYRAEPVGPAKAKGVVAYRLKNPTGYAV